MQDLLTAQAELYSYSSSVYETELQSNMDVKSENTSNGSASTPQLATQTSTESSEQSSEENLSSPVNNTATMQERRTFSDAIHPRFQDHPERLFKCQSCGKVKARERKMQKHFLKNCNVLLSYQKYTCPLPECGGPSFSYTFKNEIRIYHSCKEWSKFINSSRASSFLSLASSTYASSTSNSYASSTSTYTSSVISSSTPCLNNSDTTSETSVNVSQISFYIPASEQDLTNGSLNIPDPELTNKNPNDVPTKSVENGVTNNSS